MSENIQKERVFGNLPSKAAMTAMLWENFKKLPDYDQKVFNYGSFFLGASGGLAGLISNSLYRRALNIAQAPFVSGLPLASLPFLATITAYNAALSSPLMSGDLNCHSCAMIRGALIGVVGGVVYPLLLALPLNVGLATRYRTAPMPEKGNLLRYSVDLSRPIVRRMGAMVVLQIFIGTYLGCRHFETYIKLVQLTFASGGDENED